MYKKRVEVIIKLRGEDIFEKTATKFGTGSHIIIPKEYLDKKVKIITAEEILDRTASRFGTGAHVIIPKEYTGRKIKIVIGGKNEE